MQKFLKRNNIKIRKATIKDSLFLFNIYNQNIERNNFFSKKKINYLDHKIWLKENIKSGLIFICYKKYRIGYVRYDKFKKNTFKISIAIKNHYKKKGLGRLLIQNSLKKINLSKFKVYAYIKKSNTISKKFFKSCNFKLQGNNTYVLNQNNE